MKLLFPLFPQVNELLIQTQYKPMLKRMLATFFELAVPLSF